MSVWFVYVDRTDDGRPFYVGKGTADRVRHRDRNSDWKEIVRDHGWQRTVVYGTKDEQAAYDLEEQLVREYDTFNGWGANLRPGGYGKRSGWRHTRATCERLRQASLGKPNARKGKPGKSPPNKGVPMPEEAKQHLSRLNKGKPPTRVYTPPSEESRRKMSETHKGQPAWNKRFTSDVVETMFSDRQSGMAVKDVAEKYGTSAPTVCRLFKERRKKTDA